MCNRRRGISLNDFDEACTSSGRMATTPPWEAMQSTGEMRLDNSWMSSSLSTPSVCGRGKPVAVRCPRSNRRGEHARPGPERASRQGRARNELAASPTRVPNHALRVATATATPCPDAIPQANSHPEIFQTASRDRETHQRRELRARSQPEQDVVRPRVSPAHISTAQPRALVPEPPSSPA